MAAIGGGAGRETEGEADRERGRSAEKALKEGAAAGSERASAERGRSQEKREKRRSRGREGEDRDIAWQRDRMISSRRIQAE